MLRLGIPCRHPFPGTSTYADTADALSLIRPTRTAVPDFGTKGRCGVQPFKTVERGTRDASPQGWVYGVS